MALALLSATALELWLVSRSSQRHQGWQARCESLVQRLHWPPLHFLLFSFVILLNVALQQFLVQPDSQPFAVNILLLHAFILLWAYLTVPDSRAARESLHFWAMVFIAVFSTLLFVQSVAYNRFNLIVDFREILTGAASNSSGSDEGSQGMRPTSVFDEPSNHALVIFALLFLVRITGPRRLWITVLATASCLLNNSGLGLLLASFLAVEEASYQATIRRVGVPLAVAAVALMALAVVVNEVPSMKLAALERIVNPQNQYDPIAVRLFVPNSIAKFEPIEHLIGTGISNYASFKDGITQYDSSFILGVYYQAGILGLLMIMYTLYRAWIAHSRRAALMLLVLYVSKLGLLAPMFWGISALLDRKLVIQPNNRAPRPLRLVTVRFLSHFLNRSRRRLKRWLGWAKALALMTAAPSSTHSAVRVDAAVAGRDVRPFEDTQPAHFETSFFAPDSHSEPFARRRARHAHRPHYSELARRRR